MQLPGDGVGAKTRLAWMDCVRGDSAVYFLFKRMFSSELEIVLRGPLSPRLRACRLFVSARIVGWPAQAACATVQLRASLGQTGAILTETRAILTINGVDDSEFSDEVRACLPGRWRITEDDVAQRRDFRSALTRRCGMRKF